MNNEFLDIIDKAKIDHKSFKDPDVAHLVINHNKVVGSHLIPGLEVNVDEIENGIKAEIILQENIKISKPVHLCFGMLPKTGIQKIDMKIHVKKNSQIPIIAHCVFPDAVDVQHLMDAEITIDEGAVYSYFERHVHGKTSGIKVVPKAIINLKDNARFKTEFELIEGRVGLIDMDYEVFAEKKSVFEMVARINATEDDIVKIKEIGHLKGEYARGVLTSRIAVSGDSKAEVYNKLTATAAHARGHVDCKEIIQDNGSATAIPIVQVQHPKAHITHEAAIGSVDNKQLETLMARGLDEDEATDLIIKGLLR